MAATPPTTRHWVEPGGRTPHLLVRSGTCRGGYAEYRDNIPPADLHAGPGGVALCCGAALLLLGGLAPALGPAVAGRGGGAAAPAAPLIKID